jgi:glycosyltransferase involved in cell wall biosynthesis
MKPVPILFMSDSPALPTGLGRITKDLAVHVASMPEFRVGSFGMGEFTSSKLPFQQYVYPESARWGENYIEAVWHDFAGSDEGILLAIWDISRLGWFSRPRMGGPLQDFLMSRRFKRWLYCPIDHLSIGGKLTGESRDTLLGFDRILAYSQFGRQVLEDTLGRSIDWIPHGIDRNAFQPRDRLPGRMLLGVKPEDELVGIVATNQARKDWGTAFAAMARAANPHRHYWCHSDVPIRYWNLLALAEDFGISKQVHFTFNTFRSEELSYLYSACNITFLPSSEGFGYPIVESMACGIPCLHGDYGGGMELVPDPEWIVPRRGERLDTPWNCLRPVWNPEEWAQKIEWVCSQRGDGSEQQKCLDAVDHLDWKKLWPSVWMKWFKKGIV